MSFIIFIIAFVVSFIAVPVAVLVAKRAGAISLPGKRHIHTKPTPKLGGLAITLSVFLVAIFMIQIDRVLAAYLGSSGIIFLLGFIDDLRDINWKAKMISSFIAISIFVFGGDIWIENIGNLFSTDEIELGRWGIPFTYIAIFGVMNAINLIDGLNGLACGVSVIALVSFAFLAYISDNNTIFYLSLMILGSTLAFLRYNYPQATIFLGDSGSLFLGFSLSAIAILLTQGKGNVNPMVPVIILGIPIFDTLRVMTMRAINRKSPFKADKTHLHHLMLRSGIPSNNVVKTIWILSALMSLLAFTLREYDSWLLLIVLLIVIFCIGVFIENLRIVRLRHKKYINHHK